MIRILPLLLASAALFGQEKNQPRYEMDHYVVGILRKGPNWTPGVTPETTKIQEGHMANIHKMAATGKLVVAGPFTGNNEDYRGLFIFKAESPDEVRAMVEEDPAVKAGRLKVELLPWFAAKGIRVDPPK